MVAREIVVVSGLPRSGTSLMMQMLAAGGLPVLTDGVRAPDADNPRGYYEYEPVKALARDASWLGDARGKAVKIVSALLPHLPRHLAYRIVFMRRPIPAILASQRQMLARSGRPPPNPVDDARLAVLFERHLADTAGRIADEAAFAVLYVDYPALLAAPLAVATRVAEFLAHGLDAARMAAVVEPSLRHQP